MSLCASHFLFFYLFLLCHITSWKIHSARAGAYNGGKKWQERSNWINDSFGKARDIKKLSLFWGWKLKDTWCLTRENESKDKSGWHLDMSLQRPKRDSEMSSNGGFSSLITNSSFYNAQLLQRWSTQKISMTKSS